MRWKIINERIKSYIHTLYCSEIWGVFNVNSPKLRKAQFPQLDDCYKNFKGETLHVKFCKFILGINIKSVNHASLSELGRLPLHYEDIKSMLKYCYRWEKFLGMHIYVVKNFILQKVILVFYHLKIMFYI